MGSTIISSPRGFPCSAWTHHGDELARGDGELDAPQDESLAVAGFVAAFEIAKFDHELPLLLAKGFVGVEAGGAPCG